MTDSIDTPAPRTRSWSVRLAAFIRWLHIYLSMFAFAAIVFFSITGITLNHATWFGLEAEGLQEYSGTLNSAWLGGKATPIGKNSPMDDINLDDTTVDRLAIAEFLRAEHALQGTVTDFRIDELECALTYKGPGYAADAVIDRETGRYHLTEARHGWVSIINDLHKGRDSGAAWSLLIDAAAVLMTISSITGMWLLFYLRRRRNAGLWTAAIGTLVVIGVFIWLVP